MCLLPQLSHHSLLTDSPPPHQLQPGHKTGLAIKVQLKALSYIQGAQQIPHWREVRVEAQEDRVGVGGMQSPGTLLSV